MFYSETRAAKVCLPFVGHLMRNRKDVNQISFLNRGYAFKGLLAVIFAPTAGHYTCILPYYSNIFFCETAWPIKAKFYVKHLYNGESMCI